MELSEQRRIKDMMLQIENMFARDQKWILLIPADIYCSMGSSLLIRWQQTFGLMGAHRSPDLSTHCKFLANLTLCQMLVLWLSQQPICITFSTQRMAKASSASRITSWLRKLNQRKHDFVRRLTFLRTLKYEIPSVSV